MVGYLWKRNNIYWISILYLALGLVLTVFPDISSTVFCWGLAATTAVYSLLHFWRFYTAYKQNKKDYTALGMGVLFGAACVFCIGWQSVLLSFQFHQVLMQRIFVSFPVVTIQIVSFSLIISQYYFRTFSRNKIWKAMFN